MVKGARQLAALLLPKIVKTAKSTSHRPKCAFVNILTTALIALIKPLHKSGTTISLGRDMRKQIFDVTRKFVRITGSLPNGFVEFEFSIGEPEVAVELVMPKAAFDEFCASNQVKLLT